MVPLYQDVPTFQQENREFQQECRTTDYIRPGRCQRVRFAENGNDSTTESVNDDCSTNTYSFTFPVTQTPASPETNDSSSQPNRRRRPCIARVCPSRNQRRRVRKNRDRSPVETVKECTTPRCPVPPVCRPNSQRPPTPDFTLTSDPVYHEIPKCTVTTPTGNSSNILNDLTPVLSKLTDLFSQPQTTQSQTNNSTPNGNPLNSALASIFMDAFSKALTPKPQNTQQTTTPNTNCSAYVDGISPESDGIRVYSKEKESVSSSSSSSSDEETNSPSSPMTRQNNDIEGFLETARTFDDPNTTSSVDFRNLSTSTALLALTRLGQQLGTNINYTNGMSMNVFDATSYKSPNQNVADFIRVLCYLSVGPSKFNSCYCPTTNNTCSTSTTQPNDVVVV